VNAEAWHLDQILREVRAERDRQDAKWGGAAHDDQVLLPSWSLMITDYANWARRMWSMGSEAKCRRRLVQVAALAVAAIQAMDRRAGAV
jgi:hypothetical protein